MPINWSRAEKGKFEQVPQSKSAHKVDPEWEELLTALEHGDEIQIPSADDAERVGLARSVGRTFTVELRYQRDEKLMLLRKSTESLPEKKPKSSANGRRRKQATGA